MTGQNGLNGVSPVPDDDPPPAPPRADQRSPQQPDPPPGAPAPSGEQGNGARPPGGERLDGSETADPTVAGKEPVRIVSQGAELEGHLARPAADPSRDRPGVVLVHGFPSGEVWAERIGIDLPELANRLAEQMGWTALALRFRGCGQSTGDFSLGGWIADIKSAVTYLRTVAAPDRIWLVGFGTGGALALVAAADDPEIAGVAALGAPADFADWAANPGRLEDHAKRVGVISSSSFPNDPLGWRDELRTVRAIDAAERLTPRGLLVLHGSEDDVVPHFDARVLADAHGQAELRFIQGGGHLLRHDPRAMAVLLGWLSRQRDSFDPVAASS
ncbi:MAG: alpha/beta hydrolase family protein [Acidimicrobiales bacterium]